MEKLLSCPICQDPFTLAVEVACCSKCYCLKCIEHWISDAKTGETATCPSCRSNLAPGAWKENKPLQALADDLPASCKYLQNGCTASITRGILKEHEPRCDYAPVHCDNANCTQKLLRKDLLQHLESCPYKLVNCVLACGERIEASLVQAHFESCPMFQVRCQSCGNSCIRKELADHAASCAYKSSCPLAEFGCSEIVVSDLDAHLAQNMSSHFVFACLAIRQLQDSNRTLRQSVIALTQAMENSKTVPPSPAVPLPDIVPITPLATAPVVHVDEIEDIKRRNRNATSEVNDVKLLRSSSPEAPLKPSSVSAKFVDNESVSRNLDAQYTPSTSLEIGLKLVSALPPDAQALYSKLVNKPQLMIESLIMNQRFDCLQALYDFMPTVFREELFFVYSRKALSLPSTNYDAQMKVGLETIRGPVQVYEQTVVMLTGDASYDEELRKKHRFADPPNTDLALRLLSFCDEIKAAYFTVQLCESYEGSVTGFVSFDLNLRVVEALKKMLQFGKVLFLKHPVEAHSGIVELVDSFLSQLDLIFQIVQSKKQLQVSMGDFADQNKARSLRDKLLELNEYEIARDLCLRTNTPVEVVTVAWSLQHIKNGRYPEARQLLVPILTPANRSRTSSSSGPPSRKTSAVLPAQARGIDTQMVLEHIVQILGSTKTPLTPTSSAASSSTPNAGNLARSGSGALARDRAGLASSSSIAKGTQSVSELDKRRTMSGMLQSSSKSSLSMSKGDLKADLTSNAGAQRLSIDSASSLAIADQVLSPEVLECLFYLERFGTNTMLLKFYMKHTLLELACKHVIIHGIDAEVFLDHIVIPCSDNSLLGELKSALEKEDPHLVKSQPYLMIICRYLNEQKAYKTLVTFQVFMRDYPRAALTCIRIFIDTSDQNYRIKCLEIAKDYFGEALKQISSKSQESGGSVVMSASDVGSYVMKIEIQMEVLKVLVPLLPKLETTLKIPNLTEFTLFGPPPQRTILAWILMVHKLELGLRVLSDTIKRDEWPAVFTNAGIYAARHFPASYASDLIDNVKAAGADTEWIDLLLKAETEVFAKEKKDSKNSERMAKMITQPRLRCIALIDAGKLKSAYLEAVKLDDPLALIAMILPRAQSDNDQSVVKLCSNFVTQHTTKASGTNVTM